MNTAHSLVHALMDEYPNPVAFLAKRYPSLLRAAYCNGHDDEDITQAAWLGATNAARLYDGSRGIAFTTYALHHIRGAVTRLAHRKSARAIGDADVHRIPARAAHSTFEAAEWWSVILSRLPGRLSTVIRMNYLEDVTLQEIANHLGVSERRASQLKWQAFEKLKRTLTP